MHITMLALGSRGDIQPLATLGRGLRTAGHQVRFITFENFAPLIAEHGLDFHPIRGDSRALVAAAGAEMLSLVRTFGALAEGYARDLSAPTLGETDLIINQLPGGLYGFDLAETYALPMIQAAVIPMVRTGAFPFLPFPRLPLPGYNKATYLFGEQLVWQMYRRVINRWRKKTLQLPALPLTGYTGYAAAGSIPVLNGFSRHVVPRPADWGADIHITGSWFPPDENWEPPAGLAAFLEAGRPPVFIGFGSMPLKNPPQTTKLILEALAQSGQRGILHLGWGGLGDDALPPNIFKIDYAPYGWLFPRLGMVIHHGGSGTTAAALRAGVPSGVVSFVFDQHYWGERLAVLGVGPRPIRFKSLTAGNLAAAIHQGVASEAMRRNAATLGRKIRAERGVDNAIEVIEKIMRLRKPGRAGAC